jgi:release factor glutamine methyltransferase
MTLHQWLQQGEAQLAAGPHPERARRDAELLLMHVIRLERAALLVRWEEVLETREAARYAELIERRLAGEPIQYILGETEFFGLRFRVTPEVLIPRPETEHLVEKVLSLANLFGPESGPCQGATSEAAEKLLWCGKECQGTTSVVPQMQQNRGGALASPASGIPPSPSLLTPRIAPRIVDVGTGSGAIAVALAHKLPQAAITAIDLSQPALAVARENAERNGAAIRFLEGDLLAPVLGEQFEFVVSNPPYIPSSERETLSAEVREFEPELALFAGDDGLEVYRRLIPGAFSALISGGFVVLEIGYGQAPAIAELLTRSGFEKIDFVPDLQGIPRVACGQRPILHKCPESKVPGKTAAVFLSERGPERNSVRGW